MLADVAGAVGTACAGIIAGLFALYGFKQHAARERVQREHEMVREVHFQMAEALARYFEMLRSYPNPQISDADLRAMLKDFSPAMAKMQLVASLDTIAVLQKFGKELQQALQRLVLMRAEMMNSHVALTTVQRQMQEIMERVKELRPLGAQKPIPEIDSMTPMWQNLQQRERDLLLKTARLQLEMTEEVQNRMARLGSIQLEAVLSGRAMLGMPIDGEKYKRISAETAANVDASLRQFLHELRTRIGLVNHPVQPAAVPNPPQSGEGGR